MTTIRRPEFLADPPSGGRVVSIGVFDGVHRGHRRLLHHARRLAEKHHAEMGVVTFWPHPLKVLAAQQFLGTLMTLEQRLDRLSRLAVDWTWVVPFTKRFAALSAQWFVERYLIKRLQPKWIVVGEDFRFGRYRAAGVSELRAWLEKEGIGLHAVKAFHHGRKTVSSSLIRQLVLAGQLKEAARLLEAPYALWGRVIRGRGRGRRLGYPTANIHPRDQILPPAGVYASLLRIKDCKGLWPSVTNIGHRPTFETKQYVVVETHVPEFDSNKNMYGAVIEVFLLEFLRSEEKFFSPEDWQQQVRSDVKRAMAIGRRSLTHPAKWMEAYL